MLAETFVELVKDPNHWFFEIMLMVLFDGLIGALAWPLIKNAVRKHDEAKHKHVHCDEAHPPTLEELVAAMKASQVAYNAAMERLNEVMTRRQGKVVLESQNSKED